MLPMVVGAAAALAVGAGQAPVLIVCDEKPAMQVLADRLKTEEGASSDIVLQANLPADLSRRPAVVVYIHGRLEAAVERACIDYANAGGKLVLLHHSISSGKRANKDWFAFLGVTLPEGDVAQGGYKWVEPATIEIVNLAPRHYITSHKLRYPGKLVYGKGTRKKPAASLANSEAYLNHQLVGERTVLLGLRYVDPTGRIWEQDHAGWVRKAGSGWVVYLLPGHTKEEFADPCYGRIVMNAIVWRPAEERRR